MHETLPVHSEFPTPIQEDAGGMARLKAILDSYSPWGTEQRKREPQWLERKKQLADFLPDVWAASHYTFEGLHAIKDAHTFEKDRFRFNVRMARDSYLHTQPHPFKGYDGHDQDLESPHIYVDAPIGFSIDYFVSATRQTPAHWEPVSIIMFYPDFEQQTLFVDQLQNTTRRGEEEHLARKQLRLPAGSHPKKNLRDPFAVPEDILYEITRRLAVHRGMNVALLKPEANKWAKVHERIEAGEPEPYSITAKRRKLVDTGGEYLWDASSFPLPQRVTTLPVAS